MFLEQNGKKLTPFVAVGRCQYVGRESSCGYEASAAALVLSQAFKPYSIENTFVQPEAR
jgi:hypothetical protein